MHSQQLACIDRIHSHDYMQNKQYLTDLGNSLIPLALNIPQCIWEFASRLPEKFSFLLWWVGHLFKLHSYPLSTNLLKNQTHLSKFNKLAWSNYTYRKWGIHSHHCQKRLLMGQCILLTNLSYTYSQSSRFPEPLLHPITSLFLVDRQSKYTSPHNHLATI